MPFPNVLQGLCTCFVKVVNAVLKVVKCQCLSNVNCVLTLQDSPGALVQRASLELPASLDLPDSLEIQDPPEMLVLLASLDSRDPPATLGSQGLQVPL